MAQTAFILILARDEDRGQRLRDALRERHGHSCHVVTALEDALESIRTRQPDVVAADALVNGAATFHRLIDLLDSLAGDATLVAIGGVDDVPTARRVHVLSLDDANDPDALVSSIAEAARKAVARREDRLLQKTLTEHRVDAFEGIVGVSPGIRKIIERIRRVAKTNMTVLILGETGTGKELIADAIHRQSPRSRKPLKAVNCAGINENLLESELFGHVKGAFTGAVVERKGYFAAADGGTLFLDEIGDMPLPMQAKLLRALERREITPVGSTDVRKVDVRLVAATHADLRRAVEEKRFREDLYYRLNQWVIEVPPLRERREDIPLIAQWILEQANAKYATRVESISSDAMHLLTKHLWPGNVRELSNVIERTVVEVGDRKIEADDLPEYIRGTRDIVPVSLGNPVGMTMSAMERFMLERTLQATNGNREQAAKMLGIGTRTLYRKLKEYNL